MALSETRNSGGEIRMPFELEDNYESGVKIKVVGVGGGGNNAVDHMISQNVRGVDYVVINTDKQVLIESKAPEKIAIGEKITKGHGAGGNPDVGVKAAEESVEEIATTMRGADMVFITAGMGGGTGTGAAPVIAKLAREQGILTVGIVTRPFAFEGQKRAQQADKGIEELRHQVDSLIVIPNERLKITSQEKITLINGFQKANDVLKTGVQSISDLITVRGHINLDFADLKSTMQNAGLAHMGLGSGKGKEKAEFAAAMATSSALLESSIKGAKRIVVNITVAPDIDLDDVDNAMTKVRTDAHPEAEIIFGVAFDADMEDEIKITIIATGYDDAGYEADAGLGMGALSGMDKPRTSSSYQPIQQGAGQKSAGPTVSQKAEQSKPGSKEKDSSSSDDDDIGDFDSVMDILKQNKKNLYDE